MQVDQGQYNLFLFASKPHPQTLISITPINNGELDKDSHALTHAHTFQHTQLSQQWDENILTTNQLLLI